MRKLKLWLSGVGFALLIISFGSAKIAYATAPYLPSDLVGQPSYDTYDLNPPSADSLGGPSDTIVDTAHHRLFVADSWRHRILAYNLDTDNVLLDKIPDAVLGQPDFTSGGFTTTAANTLDCGYYCGLAYDATRNLLFVSDRDNYRVLVFDVASITNNENAVHVLGQPDFTTKTCMITQKGMCALISGLAYDDEHKRLFVPETNGARVLIFDVGTISDYMNASHVLGQPDFTTGSHPVSPSDANLRIDYSGVAFDAETQRLFVTDNGGNRVMAFDVTPGTLTNGEAAAFVLGQPDFTTGSPGATANKMEAPQGLAWDPVHRQLFVMEYNNCRVLVFDTAALSNGQDASAVLGQPDFTTNTCLSTPPHINTLAPDNVNMSMDTAHHRLYMGDAANNRVLLFDFARITSSALPGGVTGVAYSGAVASSGTQGTTQFSITAGALPPGLSLNSSTGVLTGAPTTAGSYNFTVRLVDNNGTAGSFWDQGEQTIAVVQGTSGGGAANEGSSNTTTAQAPANIEASGDSGDSSANSASGSPGADESTTTEETPPAVEPLLLNEVSGYLAGGASLTLKQHETVAFCLGEVKTCDPSNRYTITANAISASSVELTLVPSGKNETVNLHQTRTLDANGDGKDDTRVTLTALTSDAATITFQNVKLVANKQNQPSSSGKTSSNWWWAWAGGVVAAAAVLIVYRLRRRS